MHIIKGQKGITLIALVITIIVMLILVGVTISVSLNGGLFSTAKEATDETQIAKEREELLIAALGTLNQNGEVDLSKLDSSLPEGFTGSNGQYTSKTGNVFTVTEDGTITLVGEGNGEQPETPVTPTITLSTTQITKEITNGVSETVEITATLNNASGDLTWQTSDASVAEISGSGTTRTITLKKAGRATITVSYGDISATCNVTITEKPISVVLDKETIEESIGSGETATVTLTATLNNASGDLVWETSDANIAAISGNGTTRTITLKKAGTVTITVSYGNYKDTCKITVTEASFIEFQYVSNITGTLITARAKEGMTWGEFVNNPEYNEGGLMLWNDVVIYSKSALETTISNEFKTISANLFWNSSSNQGMDQGGFTFSWEKIDSSYNGMFILGFPTTNTTYSKEKFQSLFESEGGTIEYWTLNP